jgi:SAM-dependent methyltransferase
LVFFALSLFVSATLLFWVQPMFAKMVLPLLGGTPAVWNTCMVFYQAALLAGYIYAHVSARWLGVRGQALVHVAWLGLALVVLPVGLPQGWAPPAAGHPVPWLLLLLTVAVGLPFFVLSTTAPMLQQWFAHTRHRHARDPYFLYAASNLGSMVALLGYPALLEPRWAVARQSQFWTLGYGLLALLILSCAGILWWSRKEAAAFKAGNPGGEKETSASAGAVDALTFPRRLKWVLLSFAPSSLLLGVTTYISTDVAAVPLIWVVPLALYLLTFVLVFARKPLLSPELMSRWQPVAVLPLAVLFLWDLQAEGNLVLPLHLLAFFFLAMVCHGELARSRPSAAHLTEFYLWLSVGGVLGGLFNALVAPLVFNSVVEYPLAIVLACWLRPPPAGDRPWWSFTWRDLAWPAAFGLVLAGLVLMVKASAQEVATTGIIVVVSCFAALAVYLLSSRPWRYALGVAAIFLVGVLYSGGDFPALHRERSFFGVLTVRTDREGQHHLLYHGTTLHGAQSLDPHHRRDPLTYFHPEGPFGQVFAAFMHKPRHRRVAVIGLGTGSLSCYAWEGQSWTFYEIDPAVERLARDPRYFTFLQDCPGQVEVVLGDARLTLGRARAHRYDLIIFDAFSSDAVPTHLISREALQLYLERLAPGGMLLFHISNRYLDLRPVLANLAQDAGLACLYEDYQISEAEQAAYASRAVVVVMARSQADLGDLAQDQRWTPPATDARVGLWTDEFSNILSVFRWPAWKLPFPLPWGTSGKSPE